MGVEKLVAVRGRRLVDVEHEELLRGRDLEVRQGLGMMLVPVLQPSPLEVPTAANALRCQGLQVGRGERDLVVGPW